MMKDLISVIFLLLVAQHGSSHSWLPLKLSSPSPVLTADIHKRSSNNRNNVWLLASSSSGSHSSGVGQGASSSSSSSSFQSRQPSQSQSTQPNAITPSQLTTSESNTVVSALTRTLPWQAKVLLRLFGVSALESDENSNSNSTTSLLPSRFHERMKWLFIASSKATAWLSIHRRTFGVLTRAACIGFVGLAVLRRIGNWYKGMAEYEILLDQTDYDYQVSGEFLLGYVNFSTS